MLKHISYILLMAFVTLGIASATGKMGEDRNNEKCEYKAASQARRNGTLESLINRSVSSEKKTKTDSEGAVNK